MEPINELIPIEDNDQTHNNTTEVNPQTVNTSSIHLKTAGKTDQSQITNQPPQIDFEEFKNEIHVEPRGEYSTIQSAIDAAGPKTKIVIHTGIYKEHLVISKKSDLELTSKDPSMPPIIVAVNSPCLSIFNIVPGCAVKIGGLRFLHRGMRDESNGMNNTYDDVGDVTEQMEKSALTTSFGHLRGGNSVFNNTQQIEQMEINYNLDVHVCEGLMAENRGYVTAITIMNATVMIINTQITLGFLTTETTKTIPGIYCERSTVFMESVLVKGNSEFLTTGVFGYDTSLKITNSRIINHKNGGVLTLMGPKNQVVVSKTQFLGNFGCGLLIISKTGKHRNFDVRGVNRGNTIRTTNTNEQQAANLSKGPTNDVSLESNLFDSNCGTGLKIQNCSNISMIRNKMFDNEYDGAEIIDCDGLCLLNEFVKNGGDGLSIESRDASVELRVNKNVCCENVSNGIVVKGKENRCKIKSNEKITNNMKSGIAVINGASPEILCNKISTNFYQGILVCCDSSASISENKIFGNLKAGVAFGGDLSATVSIVNNEIYRGRSEGIFCIDGKGGLIARNKIFENNDGIAMFNTKDIEISENDIFKNVRSGLMIAAKSTPKMYQNQIKDNLFIGMYIVEESAGIYSKNIIMNNPTQVYYSNSCKNLIDSQAEENTIEGRIDMETRCVIF